VFTDPEYAAEFVRQTKVDMLAPSLGNVHGEYAKRKDGSADVHIQYERFEKIKKTCPDVYMVLHGTNSYADEDLRKCVRAGMVKMNVNKLIMDDYTDFVNEQTGKLGITALMEGGIAKYQASIAHCMDVCGSTGKA